MSYRQGKSGQLVTARVAPAWVPPFSARLRLQTHREGKKNKKRLHLGVPDSEIEKCTDRYIQTLPLPEKVPNMAAAMGAQMEPKTDPKMEPQRETETEVKLEAKMEAKTEA